jgi:hypothetical protein
MTESTPVRSLSPCRLGQEAIPNRFVAVIKVGEEDILEVEV